MMKTNQRKCIKISVSQEGQLLKISSDDDVIGIFIHSGIPVNQSRLDFAAWFFLPVAMRLDADIIIQGTGSKSTITNAQRISEIWEAWMPSKFSSVNVLFTKNCDDSDYKAAKEDLCFYSGGVDSTYSILKRAHAGKSQSLLTIQGMDYKPDDDERFIKLVGKIKLFSEKYGRESILIKTNAYHVYDKYKVNTPTSHVSHIFSLAGAAFIFSEHFDNITIAADYRQDQQFSVHPWGSNSVTNRLFSDGSTCLHTSDDDVTRSDKMALLLSSPEALSALSFCVNYSCRPNNCGTCSKCMRTKLMFLAATGSVPDLFIDSIIDTNALTSIDLSKKSERAFFIDLLRCAKKNNRLNKMPYLVPIFEKLKSSH